MKSLRKQGIIIFVMLAMVLTACGGSDTAEETTETTAAPVVESLDSPAVTTAKGVNTDGVSVTDEPCPETLGGVPTGANPASGCIYLGMLNDYTGPYAAAGPALEAAQRAFWLAQNMQGGIGGGQYSVAIVEGFDTGYNPAKHLEGFNAQKDKVAAFAMSLGTVQTQFILEDMDKANLIAAPMSWYSGWSYKSADKGLVVEFGATYCSDGMNAVDWGLDNLPVPIKNIGIIGYAGDYGYDYAAGVKEAARARGLTVAWEYIPSITEFDIAAAVGQMATSPVDAVYMATTPTQTSQISGGAAQLGIIPMTFMASPAYNEAFIAEGSPIRDLFLSGAFYSMAWVEPFEADTPGHAAMRATWSQFSDSASPYIVAGWSSQYHLRGVLEAGFKGGDLTPAGIRRAAANVTVESDGMMGARELGQNRADIEGTVNKPDASVASGTSSLAVKYAGPTAKAYDWEQGPCS
jgi:ABC-type branched-subunit amino acid transport system substrate-binding protein